MTDHGNESASEAEQYVENAVALLDGFEDEDTEIKVGSVLHAIEELQNARRALPDDF